MNIEWNKVTWYSKLLALILFSLTFFIGFNLGKEYAEIKQENEANQSIDIKPTNTVSYSCKGGKTISASYYEGESKIAPSPDQPPVPGGSIVLTFGDGSKMKLNQTISADGGRYANADESFVFWDKGNNALVLENDKEKSYTGCTLVKN